MNEAQVFVAGYVAREPRFRTTHNGYSYTSLRVGYTPRRMDRDSGEWSDSGTSFVTVFCWRGLADNVATCVRKGDPVLIKGKLQVRPYTDKDGTARVAVEIEASSIGHDLARGVANFQRAHRTAGGTAVEQAASAVTRPVSPPPMGPGRASQPPRRRPASRLHRGPGCSARMRWPTRRQPRQRRHWKQRTRTATRNRRQRRPGRLSRRPARRPWAWRRHSDRDPRKSPPGGLHASTLLPSVIGRPLLEHGM